MVTRPPVPLAGKDTASQVGRHCHSSGPIHVATSAPRFEDARHHRSCLPTCICIASHEGEVRARRIALHLAEECDLGLIVLRRKGGALA